MTNCTGIREVNKLWSSCGWNVAQLHATNGLWQQSSSITSGSIAASSSADISTNSLQDVLKHRGYFFKVKSEGWISSYGLWPDRSEGWTKRKKFRTCTEPRYRFAFSRLVRCQAEAHGSRCLDSMDLPPCLLDAWGSSICFTCDTDTFSSSVLEWSSNGSRSRPEGNIQNHQNPCMFEEFGVPAFLSVKGGCPACHCGTWENPRHLGWATDPDAVAEAPCWLALPPGRAARCVDQRPGSIRLSIKLA